MALPAARENACVVRPFSLPYLSAHLRNAEPLSASSFFLDPATNSHCHRSIGKMRGRGRNSARSIKFFADLDSRKALRDSPTRVATLSGIFHFSESFFNKVEKIYINVLRLLAVQENIIVPKKCFTQETHLYV